MESNAGTVADVQAVLAAVWVAECTLANGASAEAWGMAWAQPGTILVAGAQVTTSKCNNKWQLSKLIIVELKEMLRPRLRQTLIFIKMQQELQLHINMGLKAVMAVVTVVDMAVAMVTLQAIMDMGLIHME